MTRLAAAAIAAVTIVAVAAFTFSAPARAQSGPDPVVESARKAGQVGEQADGYLGIVQSAPADLKARVDQINIKRRAVYTDLAAKRGVTVNDVAAAAACKLFESRVANGERYRDENGAWQTRNGAVKLPSYCG